MYLYCYQWHSFFNSILSECSISSQTMLILYKYSDHTCNKLLFGMYVAGRYNAIVLCQHLHLH